MTTIHLDPSMVPAENPKTYYCFTRTWWKRNPTWPDGREPQAGRKHTVARNLTYDEAWRFCKDWNAAHKPGFLSRKCEFDEQSR
jgi:hypothetical protein